MYMNGGQERFSPKPRDQTMAQRIKRAIYDPVTKKFFGRTSQQWTRLLVFYAIFYGVLSILVGSCFIGLFASLSDHEPTYKLEDSIIGTSPGVSIRPILNPLTSGTIIRYSLSDNKSYEAYARSIDDFLKPYEDSAQEGKNFIDCSFSNYPNKHEVCRMKMKSFNLCNKSKSPYYGYDTGSPCIFVKINRIFNWVPDCYTSPDPALPLHINNTLAKLRTEHREAIWLTCEGLNVHDKENLGYVKYSPIGFPKYYYPYTKQKNYLSPLVAVKLVQPRRNVIVNVECRAWAKNINYHGGVVHRQGSFVFELVILE